MQHARRTLACVLVFAPALLTAQESIPLNSERIEMRFGSYGLEVLEDGPDVRVSKLFSGAGNDKITRTFAVVTYPARVAPELAAEHRAILVGGSIGAVFAAAGWTVHKHNRYIGELAASPALRALMRREDARMLATHVYLLEVERGGRRFDYAVITEIHHPDYLSAGEIAAIYGRVPALTPSAARALDMALAGAQAAAASARLAPAD